MNRRYEERSQRVVWVLKRFLALAFLVLSFCPAARAQSWQEMKGNHFIIYYMSPVTVSQAQDVLQKAEECYRQLGDVIGFVRYSDFWTWDHRTKILVFPDQPTFTQKTGLPAWSTGVSDRNSNLFRSRTIVTYYQEKDFLDGLLPHEISHLIMFDFVPEGLLPVWLAEGVAQLKEDRKRAFTPQVIKAAVQTGKLLPPADFWNMDLKRERDTQRVVLFYAQSHSLVEFLLTRYGTERFQRLCQGLHEGKDFAAAFVSAYSSLIPSIAELDQQWRKYVYKNFGGSL